MPVVSKRLDEDQPWISIKYRDGKGTIRDHTLYGKKIGYKSNEDNNGIFRIYSDDTTFGVPLESLIEFKMKDGS